MNSKYSLIKIGVCAWIASAIMAENKESFVASSEKEYRTFRVEFTSAPAFHAQIRAELEKNGMKVFQCDYDELALTLGVNRNAEESRYDVLLFWHPAGNRRFPGMPEVKLYQTNQEGNILTSNPKQSRGMPLPVIAPKRAEFYDGRDRFIRTASYREGLSFSFNYEASNLGAELAVSIPIYEKVKESPDKPRLCCRLEVRPGIKIGD